MRSRAFASLWIGNFLGGGQFYLLLPLVPLIVVERGGDAGVVGLSALALGVPSIIFRPALGGAADRLGGRWVVMAGTAVMAITAAAYVIPSMVALFIGRVVHGVGWAAFNTGGWAMLARLAPAGRRAEAAGYYSSAQALAQLVLPGLGILLYSSLGAVPPLLFATALALGGMAVIGLTKTPAVPSPPPPAATAIGASAGLTERTAILPMALEGVNNATQSLFTYFMPVFVLALALPLEALSLYYPAYGTVLVAGRLIAPRLSDHVGRIPTVILGLGLALVALAVGSVATDLPPLAAAGCLAALSGSLLTPTLSAMTIDRAPPNRIGAAVATYSLGFQLGAGIGGAIWGFMIAALGPRSPFLAATLLQAATIGFLWTRRQAG